MNRIFDDYESLSRAASEFFAECARKAVQNHGRFIVALSGGKTPKRMFELLAKPPLRDAVDWPRMEVFWSDERCVPQKDDRSNFRSAHRRLLDHVPTDPLRIHPIECLDSPSRAAAAYERQIRSLFGADPPRFDLILLGLGPDGHTASLFPYSEVIDDSYRLVREVPTAASGIDRVSFTPVLINQAAVVMFLVSGEKKAAIVRDVQQGPPEPGRLPAQIIRPVYGKTIWLLDRAAAAALPVTAASRA